MDERSEAASIDGTRRAIREADLRRSGILGAWILGVLLPAGTIAVELLAAFCARYFFDPLPTWIHLALACLVPGANATLCVLLARGPRPDQAPFVLALFGASVAATLVYALVFVPLLPLAIIGILAMGLGFLPLSPYLALLGELFLAPRVLASARAAGRRAWPGIAAGALSVATALALVELPVLLTRHGLDRALSDDPATAQAGVRFLRRYGDAAQLRRLASGERLGSPTFAGAMSGFVFRAGEQEQLERVLFRVTGEGPEATDDGARSWLRLPGRGRSSFEFEGELAPRQWDRHRGTATVGPELEGLALVSSRIDASVDGLAALVYLEWTLGFENRASSEQEARCLVRLPAGGVVSRLTLWIDGEEREAAFGGRARTTRAYENVVRRRRDPALVTTLGRDQVLLRCFPVPAGGTMRVRVGVTAPLEVGAEDAGVTPLELELPSLADANFAARAPHATWIEARRPLVDPRGELRVEQPELGTFTLRGELAPEALVAGARRVRCSGPAPLPSAWSPDPHEPGRSVRQELARVPVEPVSRLVLVVDTSRSMAAARAELLAALDALRRPADVVLATDDGPRVEPLDQARSTLATLRFEGGVDASAALERGWDLAAESAHGLVVWLHGPQPVRFSDGEGLRQRAERRPDGPPIASVQLVDGAHRLAERLGELPPDRFVRLTREGLATWLAHLSDARGRVERRLVLVEESAGGEHRSSDHLVRLWAARRVEELAGRDLAAAQELAARYRLVTPVSGAVVLETREQYEASGLDPDAPPASVPTIPEPHEWLLLGVALALLGAASLRRRGATA